MKPESGMTVGFIGRVIRSALVLGALILVFGSYYFDWVFSLGLFLGTLWGCANLWLLRLLVVEYITPAPRNVRKLLGLSLVKFPVLYGAGYLLLRLGWASPVAFAAGFTLIGVVVVLKVLGRLLISGGSSRIDLVGGRSEE